MPRLPHTYSFDYLSSPSLDWTEVASMELKDSSSLSIRAFLSLFGVLPQTVKLLHQKYLLHSPFQHPRNLLWAFYFVKHYPKTSVAPLPFYCCNQTTFFQVVWGVLDFLNENLNEVIINNKFSNK
jgi:hypothetical protein